MLFYCHFPDQLLVQKEERGLVLQVVKIVYRWVFDTLEAWTMRAADTVVVNSKFTREVAHKTFGHDFAAGSGGVDVIYPCVNTTSPSTSKKTSSDNETPPWPSLNTFLSINRFERKKNIALAIHAFAHLPKSVQEHSRLVLAGGYDQQLPENKSYHDELSLLCEKLNLSHATTRTVPTALLIPESIRVIFLLSVPSSFKSTLLSSSKLLLYTPKDEHFGIVPVEAMAAGLPVLASNTGGPLETILEDETGWLRDAENMEAWTEVMDSVLQLNTTKAGRAKLAKMRDRGQDRASAEFSRTTMAERLDKTMERMVRTPRRSDFVEWRDLLLGVGVAGALGAALAFYVLRRWMAY